jgi:hypothetical protein
VPQAGDLKSRTMPADVLPENNHFRCFSVSLFKNTRTQEHESAVKNMLRVAHGTTFFWFCQHFSGMPPLSLTAVRGFTKIDGGKLPAVMAAGAVEGGRHVQNC